MKSQLLLLLISVITISGCRNNDNIDVDTLKQEVWKTIIAHNKAWAVDEDLNEQMKYVHEKIIFTSPPFRESTLGIDDYRAGYQEWIDHASVHYFREINPIIEIHRGGNFAVVAYNIEMSFDYDDQTVEEWKGIDMFSLVKKDGRWLITSDMFAKTIPESTE